MTIDIASAKKLKYRLKTRKSFFKTNTTIVSATSEEGVKRWKQTVIRDKRGKETPGK